MKKITKRTCIACGNIAGKKDFIRVVKDKENKIVIDTTGKLPGRGAYICCRLDCFQKILKSKSLERSLGIQVPNEIYENLRGVIIEQGK